MIAFGIDPGSAVTGWGVVCREGRKLSYADSGILQPKGSLAYRLAIIGENLIELIETHNPDVVGLESQFVPRVQKQFRGALVVSQARGVAAAAVGMVQVVHGYEQPLTEVAPSTIKKDIAGHGKATKQEVARAVSMILGLDRKMKEDESDALAVAMCAALQWGSR